MRKGCLPVPGVQVIICAITQLGYVRVQNISRTFYSFSQGAGAPTTYVAIRSL